MDFPSMLLADGKKNRKPEEETEFKPHFEEALELHATEIISAVRDKEKTQLKWALKDFMEVCLEKKKYEEENSEDMEY